MMKFSVIDRTYKNSGNYQVNKKGNDPHLCALGCFLCLDVTSIFAINFLKSWLANNEGPNEITGLAHKIVSHGDEVSIHETHRGYEDIFFKTSKKTLLKLIDIWLLETSQLREFSRMLILQRDEEPIRIWVSNPDIPMDYEQNETLINKLLKSLED